MSNASPSPKPEKPVLTRGQKWKRRLLRLGLMLLIALVIFRIALSILLPSAIRKAAAFYGLNAEYSRVKLGLTGGYAAIWDLTVTPQEGGEPILTTNYAEASLSTWDLLKGNLTLWRVGADGVNVTVDRAADGSIPLLKRFAAPPAKQVAAPVADGKPGKELDLSAPLKVEAFRLSRVQATIRDASVTPAFQTTLNVNIRVSDIGSDVRPTHFEMDVWSDQFVENLRVIGDAHSAGRNVDANIRFFAHGLNLQTPIQYLQVLGIRPTSDDLNVSGQASIQTSGVEGTLDALQGKATFKDIRIYTPEHEALHIGSIALSPRYLAPDRIDLGSVVISGISANAQRNADSSLAFGGLEYYGAPRPVTQPTQPTTMPLATSPQQPLPLPKISLDELLIENVNLAFTDQAIPGGTHLGLQLKQLRLANLATYAGEHPKPVELSAELSAEGIAKSIVVTGKADPFAAAKNGQFRFRIAGIQLDAIKPYLDPLGIESTFQNGSFNFEVSAAFGAKPDGMLSGEIKLNDLSLVDKDQLLKLTDAQISGFQVDPKTLEVSVASIDLAGPSLLAHRDKSGQLFLLGFKTRPPDRPVLAAARSAAAATTAPKTVAATPEPTTTATIQLPIPRVRIDRFTWKDIRLQVQDDFVQPATTFGMTDAGVELKNLAIELQQPTTRPATVGQYRTWMKFPGLVDELNATGQVTPTLSSIRLTSDVQAKGITGRLFASYLAPFGVTPVLEHGRFTAHKEVFAELTPRGIVADLLLKNVHLSDGEMELIAVDELNVSRLQAELPLIAVKKTRIVHPLLSLEREQDGSLRVAGVRLKLSDMAAPAPGAVAAKRHEKASSPHLPPMPMISAEDLAITNAQINWTDRLFAPAVQTSLKADVTLSDLKLGEKSGLTQLTVRSSVEGSLEEMNLKATLRTSPDQYNLASSVAMKGLRGGQLEAYLPPTLATTLKDGRLQCEILADVANNPAGGIAAQLGVTAFDYREGDSGEPMVAFNDAKLVASRIDPPNLVMALDEVSLQGLRALTQRTAAGDISVAGIRTATTRPADRAYPVAAVATTQVVQQAEAEVADILVAARRAMPQISIERLLVTADDLRFTDAMRPEARPVTIDQFQLRDADRLVWLGKDPMNQPANRLELTMRIQPVVEQLVASLEASPFAGQPSMQLRLTADGIHGAGINQLVPELSGKLDGAPLENGHFQATLDTALRVERHGPTQFDFNRGFNIDLALKDVAFRGGDDPRVLAGVQEVRINSARVEPASHLTMIPSLEITKPTAYVWRDTAGLHALGMLVPIKAAATTQPTATAVRPVSLAVDTPASESAATAPATATSASPAMDVQLRKLSVSGIDVTYEDKAFSPSVTVPLNQLDLEVQDAGTLSLKQAKPIRFSAMLGSGKVEMNKRGRGRLGADAQTGTEQREVFALASVNGAVALYPEVNGWAKASINGVELMAFNGAAKPAGVSLYDGIFDGDLDIRIKNRREVDVKAKAVVTDLSVSEAPNGPVAKALKLPGSLDAAVRLLEDADGSISLPVSLTITDGNVSYAALAASATGAAAQAVGVAIASSPLKLVQGAGALLGAEQPKKEKKAPPAVSVTFAPGDVSLNSNDVQLLNSMLEKVRGDRNAQLSIKHELSEADLALASARANPSQRDALDLIENLRLQKQQMLEQRKEMTIRTRTRMAALPAWAVDEDLQQLRSLDQRIESTDASLDKLLDLFRPGADRQATRRTRGMSLEIGQARLNAIRDYLQSSPLATEMKDRVIVVSPSAQVAPDGTQGKVIVTLVARQK